MSLDATFQGGLTAAMLSSAKFSCTFSRSTRSGLSWGYKAVTPYKTIFHATNMNDSGLRARCAIRYDALGGTKTETWNPFVRGDSTSRTTQWYVHVRGMSCSYVQTVAAKATGYPPPTPPTPLNLTAVADSESLAVDLSWDCATGATDYLIQRMPAGGGAIDGAFTTGGACSFHDGVSTGLQPDRSYEYRVLARNPYYDSAPSTVTPSVTTMSVASPTPTVSGSCPADLTCSAAPPYLVIQWTPTTTLANWADAGTPYQFIYVSTTSGAPGALVASVPDTEGTSTIVAPATSLTCGQTYYVVIRMTINGALSTPSPEASTVAAC